MRLLITNDINAYKTSQQLLTLLIFSNVVQPIYFSAGPCNNSYVHKDVSLTTWRSLLLWCPQCNPWERDNEKPDVIFFCNLDTGLEILRKDDSRLDQLSASNWYLIHQHLKDERQNRPPVNLGGIWTHNKNTQNTVKHFVRLTNISFSSLLANG